jgi:hypothetical protein
MRTPQEMHRALLLGMQPQDPMLRDRYRVQERLQPQVTANDPEKYLLVIRQKLKKVA